MAYWRFFGQLPFAQSREEIRAQNIQGWNPWSHEFSRESGGPPIVVPNPLRPPRTCHAKIANAGPASIVRRYASTCLEDHVWRFYVPAEPHEQGAFDAPEVRFEGFWRRIEHEESELAWPQPNPDLRGRGALIDALDRVEALADKVQYRGFSHCRLCGARNGSQSFRFDEWEWPSGYRHYIVDHFVRPSEDFERFILQAGE